ncbi:MAG: CRISPR-associated helicase Cas3' [Gammaproteobacteria bacterium]|nr:CRISPR-associated helicase Cas3' [Gammaproteobacteria bacterium]
MKPLPFSSTFAHPGDPLPVHLERVAQRAAASIAPSAQPEVRRIAFLAGLFHDIGKATPFFQTYLLKTKKKTALTPHAKSGAVLAWWYTGVLDLALWERLAVFIAVLRHHGPLNFDSWRQRLESVRMELDEEDEEDEPILSQQLAAMDLAGIHEWLCRVAEGHGEFAFPPALPPLDVKSVRAALLDRKSAGLTQLRKAFQTLEQALGFLAGFGGLLAVDKIDAALQGQMLQRPPLPEKLVATFKDRQFGQRGQNALDERRERIAATVLQTWLKHAGEPLLTLTAPTGSGKTLTILDAALAVREQCVASGTTPPRIVYCLPFTSVIDQNHGVFRAVLRATDENLGDREDVLLKHHHLVDGLFRTNDDTEYQPDGAGQLLTETWQSEIVVTTFYQVLHSLLSDRNGNLKRAGQLSGALVLMDEVQALPLRYWEALRQVFKAAAQALGTRFVLLTATRPLIFGSGDARELLPDHAEHFQALSRVRLVCHLREPVSQEAFAMRLINDLSDGELSVLVILNRRRAVRQVFERLREALPDRRIVALSTDLTPRDRRVRIRLIQRLLRQGMPCVVVTTQLIEAGVDVSFPVVHRDLAPLDSLIQSAGRCNRHALEGKPGTVHVWRLHTDKPTGELGEPQWQRIYDSPLIEVTEEILSDREEWAERDFLELSQRYFEGCWQRQDQQRVDESLKAGDFQRLAKEFELIPEGIPRTSLFVENKPPDTAVWERYRAIQDDDTLSPLEQEQRFRRMRRAFYERVIQVYPPPSPDPNIPVQSLRETGATYSRETGFIPPNQEDRPACIF